MSEWFLTVFLFLDFCRRRREREQEQIAKKR